MPRFEVHVIAKADVEAFITLRAKSKDEAMEKARDEDVDNEDWAVLDIDILTQEVVDADDE